jgi:hypothetical protein
MIASQSDLFTVISLRLNGEIPTAGLVAVGVGVTLRVG